MSNPVEVTINAVDPAAVSAFWAAALGYVTHHVRPPYTVLGPPGDGEGILLLVQQIPAHEGTGTRVHLDLRVTDPRAEVARLVTLGATPQGWFDETDQGGGTWCVLHDPEGTPFCVCPRRD